MDKMFLENNLSEPDKNYLQVLKDNLSDLSKVKSEGQTEADFAIECNRAVERLNDLRNKIDKIIWDRWVKRNAQKSKDQKRSRVDINKVTLEKLKVFDERYNTKSKASFLDMLGTELEVCHAGLINELARLVKPFVKKPRTQEPLSANHLDALHKIFKGLEAHHVDSIAKLNRWSKGHQIDQNLTYRIGAVKPINDGVTKTEYGKPERVLDGQTIVVVSDDE
jgi:hypothetical protein